jgi:glutamate synthase (NADPH) small chain
MGHPRGFIEKKRKTAEYRPVKERLKDYKSVVKMRSEKISRDQGSRCMECGIPFCHYSCPVGNVIPEWNDLLFKGQWKKAFNVLSTTNSFPEFTGLVCPATCEAGCVAGLNTEAVTIRENELDIIEHAFKMKWVTPRPSKKRTGKKVAVIGSGPAGLACANVLNHFGHKVTVFEKCALPGGILRYGIPDFKLEKHIIDRRLKIMSKEGVVFKNNVEIGKTVTGKEFLKNFNAVSICIGAREPRDLTIPGRELDGVHFAMDFLCQQNARNLKQPIKGKPILATGKHVIVVGGGDTGSDCVGLSNRQGARSVTQIELLPKPPKGRTDDMPWPTYPKILKTSSSHEEGCDRLWSILTKEITGKNGEVKELRCVKLEWGPEKDARGNPVMKEIEGSEFTLKADLVVIAMGFVHPVHEGLVKQLGIDVDGRGNIIVDENYMTTKKSVFAAGDAHRGASLVVWGIYEGQEAAKAIHEYLK